MDMQGSLRARLLSATPASTRVYWVSRPQASELPSITLQTLSGDRPQTHEGMQATRSTRVQLDYWAGTYAAARAGMDAAIAALDDRHVASNGTVFDAIFFEGERDFVERVGTTDIYRTSIDLIVWHYPA